MTLQTPPISSYGQKFDQEPNESVSFIANKTLQMRPFNAQLRAREYLKKQLLKGNQKIVSPSQDIARTLSLFLLALN